MLKLIKQYQAYIRDFGLNIIASFILTITTSLIVNPILAYYYDDETYGKILTLCSLVAVFSSAFGNSLNNVRLTRKKQLTEGYNLVILSFSLISALTVTLLSLAFYKENIVFSLLLGLHAIFLTMSSYYSVTYRIDINYFKNLLYNIVISLGYVVGLVIGLKANIWVLIYILADLFGLLYLIKTSKLFTEKYTYSPQIPTIIKDTLPLILASFLGQTLLYIDRFAIYPILGAGSVAEYSTAGFFGKSIGMVMAPIAAVMLSYYANEDSKVKRSTFWKINIIVGISGILFAIVSFIFAPFFTKLIYPSLYEAAYPYMVLANIASIINIMGTMTNPFILKFSNIKWQIIISCIYFVSYLLSGIILGKLFGLWGFAIGSIISNSIRLVVMYLIGHFSLKSESLSKT